MARFKSKAQIAAEEEEVKMAEQEAINKTDREQYLINKFRVRFEDGLSVPPDYAEMFKQEKGEK